MKRLQLSSIAIALLALSAAAAAQTQTATEVGKITVTGEGDKLGTGLLIDEDSGKAKSTVTKAQIDKGRSSANPFQTLSLLPGVNSSSHDATGLFGGNLRVRGFNSDQMGLTINGAPVNDSGNFAVYPQEYTDAENLCEMFITQGATDNEAPHVGASGGNLGLLSCGPEDKRRVRLAFSGGSLNYLRTFARFDTGKIGNFKGFISLSHSESDKWKGPGKADRDHVDATVEYKLGNINLGATVLYNRAVNNNYRSLSWTEYNTAGIGYWADYSATIPQHVTPAAGTKQTDTGYSSTAPAYYGFALNPFENALVTAKANIQLTPALRWDIEPYFWYGYGTGGVQQNTLTESSIGTAFRGGIKDLNGDGDTLDVVRIYRGSVTNTHRPGVNTKLSYTVDNHKFLLGAWYERANHKQTAPATWVDNAGNIGDLWLKDSAQLVRNADGSLYQNRDTLTISTGKSVFLQDTIDLLNSKLSVTPAVSYRQINRDFTNYASNGSGAGVDYKINKTYSKALPSLSATLQFTPETQGFAGVSKNFKAPGNFEYFSLAQGVTFTNGVGSSTGLAPLTVQSETSTNLDAGVRFRGNAYRASVTGFLVKFKDRIAVSYDPNTGTSHSWNVGDSTVKGVEFEAGTVPVNGFSAYTSLTYTNSTTDQNMLASATTTYATAGKQFPDTPRVMGALSLQYTNGPVLLNLAGKYTGLRYLTMVNDIAIGGFSTLDFNAAYKLPSDGFFKNPILRLNVSNLTNKQYLTASLGSGSSIAINAAGNPYVYPGAPRFFSVTGQADF